MNSPILKAISQAEYQTWFDRHLPQLQHRSPFHHTAWLEAVAQGVQFELRFIGVYEGSDLVAAVPGFLARRGPFRLFGSPLRGTLTSYLGPVGLNLKAHSDGLSDLILACSQFARQQWGAAYTRFTLRDAPPKFQPELGLNWKQQRPGSYRLDLSKGEETLWNSLESDCRRNVRRAERVGIEIVPFDDPALFYQILDETFRRHGTSSWQSERFYQLLLSGLLPRDLLWAWGARYEGRIIAAGLFLHDDLEMHFISGASLPQFGSLPTSYLLHWHAIKTAIRSGLKVFNSDVSRVRSIDQFKESFRPSSDRRYTLIWAPGHVIYAQRVFKSSYYYLQGLRSWMRARLK